ncbi:transcription factor S-II [Colletotrichum fioriniae PJ7]|uniref:DNA-directed RNA polymerase I subunit RPA12 n=1 Tax=Colletotrichum fioriniae PJ7 TaxID=1445577 RepID=A0A010RNM7_9PEZI|nr:transcription factor S-II [Colletotrichum fioriniae PJ7]
MSAIGTLVFCTDCGNLLPASMGTEKNTLTCDCCGADNKGKLIAAGVLFINAVQELQTNKVDTDIGAKTITTQTKPSDFPSQLRQKLQSNVQTVDRTNVNTEATIKETCPKCGAEEVRFTAVQLRSADEGSTIFFTCECGFKYANASFYSDRASYFPTLY